MDTEKLEEAMKIIKDAESQKLHELIDTGIPVFINRLAPADSIQMAILAGEDAYEKLNNLKAAKAK